MLQWLAERVSYFYRPESVPADTPNRILIIAPGSFRTAFRALSPLTYLTDRFPDLECALVVAPEVAPLLHSVPSVSVIFPWIVDDKMSQWRPTPDDYRTWNSFNADWIIVLDPHCARIADNLSAQVKIGFCNGPIDTKGRSGWLAHAAKKSDRWRTWFTRLGGVPEHEIPPTLTIPENLREFALERWDEHSDRAVLLLPGTNKKWNKFWQSIEDSLKYHGYYPVKIAGMLGTQSSRDLKNNSPVNMSVTSPLELLALCNTAKVCLTGEEEYAAIASISGTPTGRFDALGGLWEGDRSRHLIYRRELDADITTALNFVRDIVPIEQPIVSNDPEERITLSFDDEF